MKMSDFVLVYLERHGEIFSWLSLIYQVMKSYLENQETSFRLTYVSYSMLGQKAIENPLHSLQLPDGESSYSTYAAKNSTNALPCQQPSSGVTYELRGMPLVFLRTN